MATILITGAFGFVGTNLSAWLASRGHRLLALDVSPREPSAYAAFRTWDQLDAIDWDAVDAVIHLAGKAHDTRHTTDAQSYFDINLGLTRRIFERFRASSARVFIASLVSVSEASSASIVAFAFVISSSVAVPGRSRSSRSSAL